MFILRSVFVFVLAFLVIVGGVCVTGLFLWSDVIRLENELRSEQSLASSLRDEVADLRASSTAATDLEGAYRRGLREAAPNIVFSEMTTADIRACALEIVMIEDRGVDEDKMGYSTTTLIDSSGARVTYAFKVDESHLDTASRLFLNAGRRIVAGKKEKEIAIGQ